MVKRKLDLRIVAPEPLAAALQETFPDATRNQLDGEKYIWKDQWVQVRASGTEPVVRIIAEAPTETRAEALVALAVDAATRSQSAGSSA